MFFFFLPFFLSFFLPFFSLTLLCTSSNRTFYLKISILTTAVLSLLPTQQIATEHLFEHFDHKFRNKEGYRDVMKKIKDELMLMGFISVRKFSNRLFFHCLPPRPTPITTSHTATTFFLPFSLTHSSFLSYSKTISPRHACQKIWMSAFPKIFAS